jgi:Zn-dependent M28 family amino/carboxypeptidase
MNIPIITRCADLIHIHRKIIISAKNTVENLSVQIGDRSAAAYANLEKARIYLYDRFSEMGACPSYDFYTVEEKQYANIVVEIEGKGKRKNEIIIIGAHYDTVEGSSGANDNATGIAGLLELYRLILQHKTKRTIRLIAFTLEEPPYFNSDNMGSMVYASRCAKKNETISLMISLDMIGYGGMFVKQSYPFEDMKNKYPSTGDFLSVAALPCYSSQAFLWKKIFNQYSKNKLHEFVAPASVEGISYSDHSSFHKMGFPSLLITDTGHYRNENYHTENDTIDTVNFSFLAENIVSIGHTVVDIANRVAII